MKRKTMLILICGIFLSSQVAHAFGLSTTFGRVKVENMRIGQTYSMAKDGEMPFTIKNTSDVELELKIETLIPKEKELIEGYEAIPDASWIELEKETFTLPPESEVSTDVIIKIPDDEIHKGKKYQIYIWSYTTGGAIGVGLKSKLLISIAE